MINFNNFIIRKLENLIRNILLPTFKDKAAVTRKQHLLIWEKGRPFVQLFKLKLYGTVPFEMEKDFKYSLILICSKVADS